MCVCVCVLLHGFSHACAQMHGLYIYFNVCVCVSTPVPQGSASLSFPPRMQGARRLISHPCQRSYGNQLEESWDAGSCTCQGTVDHAFPLSVCFHGPSCYSPQQVSHRSSLPLVSCRLSRESLPAEYNHCSTFQMRGPFHPAVPSPSFSTWELS